MILNLGRATPWRGSIYQRESTIQYSKTATKTYNNEQ